MKAAPMKDAGMKKVKCEPHEATHIMIHTPGPFWTRIIPVVIKGSRDKASEERNEPVWTWNGDVENPTLKPSIRTQDGKQLCHSFVTDGEIKFLNDSTHEFAGQTLPLEEIDWE